jgi:hypothetical protein
MRLAVLLASLLLAGCSDDYVIKLDAYQRAITEPSRGQVAVRAKNERTDKDAWIRLESLRGIKLADGLVRGSAPHRKQNAAMFFALSVGGAALSAGGAIAIDLGDQRCTSFCGVNTFALVFGSLTAVAGSALLVAGSALGAMQLRKPDSEVKPSRSDVIYVE